MEVKIEGGRLSPQQKRLWLLQRESPAYHSQCALLFEGSLDAEKLKEAWQRVVNRHEILRTTFLRRPGLKIPYQIIADSDATAWLDVDLSDFPEARREAEIEEIFRREARRRFDFEQGPLLRLCLFALTPQKHILLFTLPSLCADARTFENLFAELTRALAQPPSQDEDAEELVQYPDYSEWGNELLEDEEAAPARERWPEDEFSKFASLALPFEISPAQKSRFEPAHLELKLERGLEVKIKAQAQKYETSARVFLLACWQTLLWRLTGKSGLTVGAACDGRTSEELNEAAGLFAKWLPVRSNLESDLPFNELLARSHAAIREARDWQDYFFWEPKSDKSGDPGAPDSFSAGFEYESWPAKSSVAGLQISMIKLDVCFERFKVKLRGVERDDTLAVELHYDPQLFSAEAVERLGEQYTTLLACAAERPEAGVGELEILSEARRRQLLVEFNDTAREYPPNESIQEMFERQVKLSPDDAAVAYEGQRLSYSELNARANQLGHRLQKLKIGPDVPVALCFERSLDLIVGMLGILKAGGAYVPLEPMQPKERLGYVLEDVAAPVILTQQKLVPYLPEHDGHVICLDSDWAEIARESRENPSRRLNERNLVYVIFTSGSTGRPKGVGVEQRQLVNYVKAIEERLEFPPRSSFATVSTFAADLGHTMIFPSLTNGGCLHIISQERASDPEALADYFEREQIDCLKIVPSHLEALLTWPHPEQILPRRRLVLGGEAARPELVESLKRIAPGCEVFNHYGPTETTVGVITYRVKAAQDSDAPVSIPLGRPIANTEIYILDAKLQPVAIETIGELYIGGAGVARGYVRRQELTAERFIPDPFSARPGARLYKTGDLARYRSDGNIEFLGRADNQIKFHGFRVELDEIKNALNRHPQIRDSVIVLARDKNGNDSIVAYYVSRKELEVVELREFLQQSIIEETIPNVFAYLRKLPLTLNGKVNHHALPSLVELRQRVTRTFVEPRTPTESRVAEICAEVLGVEKVSIQDNFFEIGGHSLLATRVISKLREAFQIELPLRTLFEEPTVERLSLAITQMQVDAEDDEEMRRMIEELEVLTGDAVRTAFTEEVGTTEE